MIHTVTINPSLDYYLHVDSTLSPGISRATDSRLVPGGKGINVSIALSNFNIESRALGFAAGSIGELLTSLIDNEYINKNFHLLREGETRINIKTTFNKDSLDINANGPTITKDDLNQIIQDLNKALPGDYVVLTGSVPSSLGASTYSDIISLLSDRGLHFVVDADGDLLKQTLALHPFLIKPNREELSKVIEKDITSIDDALISCEKLCLMGARNILASMGEMGGVFVNNEGTKFIYHMEDKLRVEASPVGAGDSSLAAFLYKYLETYSYESAFYYSMASGIACANEGNIPSQSHVDAIYKTMNCSSD